MTKKYVLTIQSELPQEEFESVERFYTDHLLLLIKGLNEIKHGVAIEVAEVVPTEEVKNK